jgi:hypothetical protein
MATTYKVLGQVSPANTSNADLYTAPSATQTIVSTLAVANVGGIGATAKIFVRQSGATAAASNAIAFDAPISSNSTVTLTLGITLDEGDVLTVQSSVANTLTFHAFGSEIS